MSNQELKTLEFAQRDKMKRDLALLEAALYVAGRPLDLKTLASTLKTRSAKKTFQLSKMLVEEYKKRDTALEVIELEDGRFVMQLKAEYTPSVQKLATRPLLSVGPLKTLSYIAYRQPVPQTQVITVRGHHAYHHLKEMENLGLIHREEKGRTKIIRTTAYFADYFGLSHDPRVMKQQLKSIFNDFTKPSSSEEK